MADRWVQSLIVYIFLALIIALGCLWPLGPHAPTTPPAVSTIEEGQETYYRQLELGWRFEGERAWEDAKTAYAEAALASQSAIAVKARNGLHRVLAHQTGFWHQAQANLRKLTPLWIVITVVFGFWIWFNRPIAKQGYVILPFENYSDADTENGLHALLNYFLQEAHDIHLKAQNQLLGFATPEFPLFATLSDRQDALTNVISSLETVSVGGIDLPFGELLVAVRRWMHQRKYTIHGNVHKHEERIHFYIEIRDTNTNDLIQSWTITDEKQKLESLVQEMAYRLLFYLEKRVQIHADSALGASSWRSLLFFTQALELLQGHSHAGGQKALKEAREKLEKVAIWDPGYLPALYCLGITLTRVGEYAEARDYFKEIINAEDHLELEATYNMGLAYYYEFNPWAYDRAIECFQTVIEKIKSEDVCEEDMTSSLKLLQSLAFAGLANVAAQFIGEDQYPEDESQGSMKKAVENNAQEAHRLIKDAPLDPQIRLVNALIYNAQGIAAYYAGEPQEAQTQFKQAIQFQPDNYVAYGYLALVSLSQNDEHQARAWFECTTEWEPPSQYIEYYYYKFGQYYYQKEDWENAIEYYSLAPNRPFAVNYLGESYAKMQQYSEAIAQFRRAIQLNKKIRKFWLNLAYYLTKMGEPDLLSEAEEAAKRAISIRDDWQTRDILGWIYYSQNRLKKAEAELQNSIKENDQIVQPYYHLALVYQKVGNLPKAIEVIEEGFKTQDKNPKWRRRAADLRDQIKRQIASDDQSRVLQNN